MQLITSASQLQAKIEHICSSAKQDLVLISPFIKLGHKSYGIWEQLETILKRQVPVLEQVIIITKPTSFYEKRRSTEFFKRIKAHVQILENLHSKIYLNEHEALITTMNLSYYSTQNNYEIGTYLTKDDDAGQLQQLRDHVNELLELAKPG
jgi:phosphatidylserine/phosphatidylglycerophosphate/cardiolipin synthase-like enzyme